LASGCYLGSATNTTLGDLVGDGGWELVEGVPAVRQAANEDCGAAALAMVLGYWRLPVTRDGIAAANPPAPERGIKAAALRDFARRQGMQAFIIQGQLADLDREIHLHHPVLVGVMKRYGRSAYSHYEVVVGVNHQKQRILTLDPARGLRVNSREGFAAEWAAAGQVTLVVFPQASAPQAVANTGERRRAPDPSKAGGVTTLRIVGELDAVTTPDLRPFVDTLVAERHPRVVVDVSGLRLIDSSGVGAVVFLYKRAKEHGGVVTVQGLCEQPLAIFKLLRMDRVLLA